jgi:methylmalonyl-CoA mutase
MPKEIKPEPSNNLFADFEPVSRAEWEEVIQRDLDGADYKEILYWDTREGFSSLPFYTREDLKNLTLPESLPGEYPYLRGTKQSNNWNIAEDVTASGIEEANGLAKQALKAGADTLYFFMQASPNEGMLGGDLFGLPLQNQKDMRILLDGIDFGKTSFYFDGGITTPLLPGIFINELERQNIETADRPDLFHYDPFTWGARHGRWPNRQQRTASIIEDLCQLPFQTLGIDGTFYHHCGSSIIQELGTALAIGSEYLATATEKGVPVAKAAASIHMRLPVGSLYFPEIARFRAVRMLWSKMVSAYDSEAGKNAKLYLLAETSPWNKTVTDPYNNVLRSTTEAMSAVIGGADSVRIAPLDDRFRLPTDFSRRIARNIHHILQHESRFHKVTNPAAGSFYIEQLTDTVAAKSWEFFQFLEKQGGFIKAVEGGFLQNAIKSSGKEKQNAVRKREQIFVGCNHFPDQNEKIPEKPYKYRPVQSLHQTGNSKLTNTTLAAIKKIFADGAYIGDSLNTVFNVQKQLYPPLEPVYAAQEFEELRTRTQKLHSKSGKLPVAVILSAGDKKMRIARASFARNFLGVTGYDIQETSANGSIDSTFGQITSLRPDIIVLCSSDKEYAQLLESFGQLPGKMKKADPILMLAGNPGSSEQYYRNAGIDYFIYSGIDMIEILNEIQEDLEERLL